MGTSFDPQQAAEFDKYAGRYEDMHRDSVKASGEDPEVLRHIQTAGARAAARARIRPAVLDFGCGIGNLTRFLVRSFPRSRGTIRALRAPDSRRRSRRGRASTIQRPRFRASASAP